METDKCNRCGHEWLRRKLSVPTWCPGCNSPYWNKERKLPIKKGSKNAERLRKAV